MTDDEEETQSVSVNLTIGGIKVRFPYKPYPAQTVLMSKIIMGCKTSQNCLLESPTGSGKTLALLCAALAWQGEEHAKKRKYELEMSYKVEPVNDGTHDCDSCNCSVKGEPTQPEVISDDDDVMVLDDDDDFKPEPRLRQTQKIKIETPKEDFECECGCHLPATTMLSQAPSYKVPKIYYGTRTHKQIAQLASELGITAYRNTKMTILASREHTCINEAVARGGNKNEECKKLLEQPQGGACPFKHKVPKLDDFGKLYEAGIRQAWTLETFVDAARIKGACPYYATRELLTTADLVFCPYNYLIDPFIRNSMNIKLERDIVIFDEAHNIEDACREAASIHVSSRDVEEVENRFSGWETPTMLSTIERLKNYIHDEGNKIPETEVGGQLVTGPILGGADLVAHLEQKLGLDHETCVQLNTELSTLVKSKQEESDGKSSKSDTAISVKLESVLGSLLGICGFIQKEGNKHAEDFRMLVSKQQVAVEDNHTPRPGRFVGKGRNRGYRHEIVYSLHFWCLNPAVVFESIVEDARCIVLASGTLSPMATFQSELGTAFPIQFEAGHVIGRSQMFAASIGVSPRDRALQATYKYTETFEFQDGVGDVVEEVCKVTPGGVLLFLTSYRLIDKIVDRWRSTGLYSRISGIKRIFVETSGATAQFEETLAEYYACCSTEHADDVLTEEESEHAAEEDEEFESDDGSTQQITRYFGGRLMKPAKKKRKLDDTGFRRKKGVTPMSQRSVKHHAPRKAFPSDGTTGALFLAVYRGKVSEGMNFANDYARAVIAVGIPYPALQDPQIKEKRAYNDIHCRRRQILSGGEWYECQAFRALNQALGRCIRHRTDWGAIILLDERFTISKMRCNEKVSKWVRERRVMYHNFGAFLKSLCGFIKSDKFPNDAKPRAVVGGTSSPMPQKKNQTAPSSFASKYSFTPSSHLSKPVLRPTENNVSKDNPCIQSPTLSPMPPSSFRGPPRAASSTSPDIFDAASSERSVSAFGATSPLPSKGMPKVLHLVPVKSSACHVQCRSCDEEVFFGNCFVESPATESCPRFIRDYYGKIHHPLPKAIRIGECGTYGVRGNDSLISAVFRIENADHSETATSAASLLNATMAASSVRLNATFDTDDMVAYEAYVCKCMEENPWAKTSGILCWSIVGIQPNNTPKPICELLNKVIFNPDTVVVHAVPH